jgi:outer membrane protein assembly factor BamB
MPRPTPRAQLGLFLLVLAVPARAADEAPAKGSRVHAALDRRSERAHERLGARPAAAIGVPSPTRLFFMTGAGNAVTVRPFADVTGDGNAEVLAGIEISGADNVFCLDGASTDEASVVWSIATDGGVSGGSPVGDQGLVPAADAGADGFPDVLVGTGGGGRTAHALDGAAGGESWRLDTYEEPASGWVYSLAEMDDSTGDDAAEVALGAGSESDTVFYVDGASAGEATVLWRWGAPDGVGSVRNLGDADGDGTDDVLVGVLDAGEVVVALDGATASPTGDDLWQYAAGETVFAVGVTSDQTGDGVAEALAAVWASDGSAVRCLDGASGVELWSSTDVLEPGMAVEPLADVTGDGVPEILVASWDNAVHLLDGADGSRVWRTEVGTANGGDVWSARAIADLDGDGGEDVVAGSFDTHAYAMNGATGEVLWAFETGNRVFSVAPLADLDGDGRPEVVVGTQDTTSSVVVHVLSGGVPDPAIFSDGFESGDTGGWDQTVP